MRTVCPPPPPLPKARAQSKSTPNLDAANSLAATTAAAALVGSRALPFALPGLPPPLPPQHASAALSHSPAGSLVSSALGTWLGLGSGSGSWFRLRLRLGSGLGSAINDPPPREQRASCPPP